MPLWQTFAARNAQMAARQLALPGMAAATGRGRHFEGRKNKKIIIALPAFPIVLKKFFWFYIFYRNL